MEEEIIGIGEGNPALAKTCESLFYKNGNPAMYSMAQRLSEPPHEFKKNCPLEVFQEEGLTQ